MKIFYDDNGDFNGDMSELIDSTVISGLAKGDSQTVSVYWTVPFSFSKRKGILAESRTIIVELTYPEDQRPENSIAIHDLLIGIPNQSVVINEILYAPDTSQVEFVEIYNRSNSTLNLMNWSIADASSTKIITPSTHYFVPQQFRLLTGDSLFFNKYPAVPDSFVIVVMSMPSLNNTDDPVVIKDDVGNVVDSLHYYSSWGGGSAKSLERRDYDGNTNDPSNWVSCLSVNRSTPGLVNSILQAFPYPRNTLLINEIMFSPFSGEPEYVEIYNPADTNVNMVNWNLQIGNDKTLIVSNNFMLAPKEYVVLAQHNQFSDRFDIPNSKILLTEHGLPTLPNSGGTIMLQDLVGNTIDSVTYSPDWGGGNGTSIERIRYEGDANSSDNWGSCVFIEGGTPGAVNSNVAGSLRKKIKISSSPNPFLVDQGEKVNITIEIPVTQARMTVKIYDNQGRLIQTLLNNSLTGSHREIEWDGKDRNRNIARMGIYIIYVEVIDENSGFNKSAKQTVVLGRKL